MKNNPALTKSHLIDTSQLQLTRKLLPTTPEAVNSVVVKYFNDQLNNNKAPTFSGLANALGLTRNELIKFEHDNPNIYHIIRSAKQMIVDNVEQLIFNGNPPGGLTFWLKNNDDWVDKFEYEHKEKKISDLLKELENEGQIIKGEISTD